jgi:ribose/xylose/arabinose/galactoside ABC-type transport system permease subunit
MDTAHNTALSLVATTGLCGLFLGFGVAYLAVLSLLRTHGALLLAFGTAMVVWFMTSLVATVEENRTSWLLIGVVALAGRLAEEAPEALASLFSGEYRESQILAARSLASPTASQGSC